MLTIFDQSFMKHITLSAKVVNEGYQSVHCIDEVWITCLVIFIIP